ncbi:hypothetical protein [Roseisolibacter agri]|uniref:DUF305 domain-containing protein n=1 Tax=Roseisolibacter agri TaxID=2014610 RepID=A0AA37VCY8_9BACT|nr:hypothetical protein [Roseisolibacter agri]GLC28213.1 hypothetical protein rosag_47260 [Roseisolibacter agri]
MRLLGIRPVGRMAALLASAAALGCTRGREADRRGDSATRDPVPTTVAAPAPARAASAPLPPPAPPAPPASVAALPAARDADQDFLRHMLDHHEALITSAHEGMMQPAGHAAHGTAQDPAETDAALDAEKREMLALLDRLYGEQYSPRPGAGSAVDPSRTGGAARPTPPLPAREAAHAAAAASEAGSAPARYREGVELIDRFLPRLRRPAVRALAVRLRATQGARASTTPPGPRATPH